MKAILPIVLFIILASCSSAQQERDIITKTGTVHYQSFGKGKTILIINGGPGFSSEGFQQIAEEIASLGYRTVIYDQRGTGMSTLNHIDNDNMTLDLMVQDIELIRNDLNLDQWIIFGHSFGGMLANEYTKIHPNRVEAIIHSSSGGVDLSLFDGYEETFNSRLTAQEIDSLNYWRTKADNDPTEYNQKKKNDFMASAYVYHKQFVPLISDRLMQGNMEINELIWSDMIKNNFDCKEQLKSFTRPVLIIQGKQDVLPAQVPQIAASVFSNSKVLLLDECGHYGWLDQHDQYIEAIREFLSGL